MQQTNMVLRTTAALCAFVVAASISFAAVGQEAPAFSLRDYQGTPHALVQYRGRYVVLEWVNFGCPFVGKHYRSGNMQALQREYTAKGVVWLSICSSAAGNQGFLEGAELTQAIAERKAAPTAYLVDKDGAVGRMYGAKTTPDMFIIDPAGRLIYSGGIDDIASTNVDDIPRAHNYVREVLDNAMNGKPVPVSTTRSYGCSVKY